MGLIEFVLGIASSVLTNVITDLVTGQKKAAQMEEIRREVARQLEMQARFKKEQEAQIQQLVIEEIDRLVEHNSDLKIAENQIKLKKRIEIPLLSPKRNVEEELKAQLDQLNAAVLARRQELHVPTEPVREVPQTHAASSRKKAEGSSVEWKQVRKNEPDDPTSQEIRRMQERIERRRSGEVLSDEQ